LGTAEKKLLVVFIYYAVLSIIVLTAFTLITRNINNFTTGLQIYFFCEQGGFDPDNLCSRDYLKNSYPSLVTLSYVLVAFFPIVNFIYVVNLEELNDFIKKLLPKSMKKSSQ